MADLIKCPVCGENNFSDQEFCQFCQSRLQTGVDSFKGSDEGFKPGQAPTKKATADLEPILPQWLREARSSARDAADDDAVRLPAQETARPSSPPDLLAGLQAQSGGDEEDDTPDWLASITGASPTAKKSQSDSSEVRWVELGGSKDFAQEESADENETPSWLANLASTGAPSAEKDELTDWMREASGLKPLQSQPPVSSEPAADSDTPDWLRQMAVDSDAKNSGAAFDDASQNTFAATPADSDTPDWLRQMAADSDAKNSGAASAVHTPHLPPRPPAPTRLACGGQKGRRRAERAALCLMMQVRIHLQRLPLIQIHRIGYVKWGRMVTQE
ncbi:MAG: hypothetical protein IPL71_00045 [Anaerolineales bacterium]|uniref:hypothetical protein n=1 Tax=Candidatus Villigracilis proximus TaxID=3140683 RepID=UPI0031347B1A|nr:hypothetical protein [Anaerolineales bacterium]